MTRGKVAGKECSFRNDVAERIRKKGGVLARASAGKLATWAGCPHAPRSQVCSRRLTWCCAAAEQATRQAFKMKPARSAPLRSCSMQQARAVKMQRCNVRQGGQGGWLEDVGKVRRCHATRGRGRFLLREIEAENRGEGGEGRGAGGEAHTRTCTRWLLESATTTRPSLSMAMPPWGWLNCPLPEPWLPMVRTWPPSAYLSTCTR